MGSDRPHPQQPQPPGHSGEGEERLRELRAREEERLRELRAREEERSIDSATRPPDVSSPRAKGSGHKKKTADKWNQ